MKKQAIMAMSIGITAMLSIMSSSVAYAAPVDNTASDNTAEVVADSEVSVDDLSDEAITDAAIKMAEQITNQNTDSDAVNIEDRFGTSGHEEIEVSENKVIMPNITRDGMTLLYWSNTPDGSGERYEIGSEYVIGTDAEVYAIWSENEFTFNLNDETVVNKKTDDGMFMNAISGFEKGDVLDVTPETLGMTYAFNNASDDCEYEFKAIEATNSKLTDEGKVIVESSDFMVVYQLTVTKDGKDVATSKVSVNFADVNVDVDSDDVYADGTFEFTLDGNTATVDTGKEVSFDFTKTVKSGIVELAPEALGLDATAYGINGAASIKLDLEDIKADSENDIITSLSSAKVSSGDKFKASYKATVEDANGNYLASANVTVNFTVK